MASELITPEVKGNYETIISNSIIFDEKCERDLPRFDFDKELILGKMLGQGGFCNVNEISKIVLSDDMKEQGNSDSRTHMSMNYLREGDARYAIKKLRKDLDEAETIKGIVDLALEAKFLAVTDHPHIVKIRGIGAADYLSKDFYVVLDRLYNTLSRQIVEWTERKVKMNKTKAKLLDRKGKKRKELNTEMLKTAYDISSALDHLHQNSIIYRDLSPDNVGFDVRGEVKIFDFGLAKELLPSAKLGDGNYKLTGCTGSLRFMAPEVVLCKPYNTSADSFSFGILLWNIMALTMPYMNFTIKMYVTMVAQQGHRPQDPAVKEDWPPEITKVMKSCWDENPKVRPTLDRAKEMLGNIIMAQSFGTKVELDLDMSKRSKHGSKALKEAQDMAAATE